jgi:tetratricopeptide (TPR) repeat protein
MEALKKKDSERYELMIKIEAERIQDSLEDEMILAKKPRTWEEFAIHGLVYNKRGQYEKAKDLFREALNLNPTNLIILAFLLPTHVTPELLSKGHEIVKKYDISSPYDDFLRLNDLAFLYRSNFKEGWKREQMAWMPERLHNDISLTLIEMVRPSPHLIEVGKKIENADLNKNHWTFNVLAILGSQLDYVGFTSEEGIKAEDFIVRALKEYRQGLF